jgi:hypothetical protein
MRTGVASSDRPARPARGDRGTERRAERRSASPGPPRDAPDGRPVHGATLLDRPPPVCGRRHRRRWRLDA